VTKHFRSLISMDVKECALCVEVGIGTILVGRCSIIY
jgi:hypothetical protein